MLKFRSMMIITGALLATRVCEAKSPPAPTTRPAGFIVQMQTFESPAEALGMKPEEMPLPAAEAKATASIEAMAYPDHDYLARQMVGSDVNELSGSVMAAGDGKAYRVKINWKHQSGAELKSTQQFTTMLVLTPNQPARAGGGVGTQMIVTLKTPPSVSARDHGAERKPNYVGGGGEVRP